MTYQIGICKTFEFHVAQIYIGHDILRCDRPAIKNNVNVWKVFPDVEITNVWTRTIDKDMKSWTINKTIK